MEESYHRECQTSLGYIHIIKSSANMLQYLIKDLIDLMNVKLDRFIKVCQPFNAIDACLEVLAFFEVQSREKGLLITHSVNDEALFRINELAGDR
jgi:signal transduction histidine kinase